MKLSTTLLTASLFANAAMAVWLGRQGAPAENASRKAPILAPSSSTPVAVAQSALPRAQLSQEDVRPATDLPGLIAQLRARGFPPALIRAIVAAEIRESLGDSYRALAQKVMDSPFWRAHAGLSDPAIDRARRALDRQVAERTVQLLGPAEAEMSPAMRASLQRQYGSLSPEKVDELIRIRADYADLTYQVRAETRGLTLPEDAARLKLLSDEQQADIAQLLTPEERVELGVHSSATADRMRRQLSAFQPTEEEFRALWQLEHDLDVKYGSGSYLTPDQQRQRDQAERDLAPQLTALLGPERYADYQRTTDPTWVRADQFATQLELPSGSTAQLVALERDFTARARATRIDGTLTLDQRNAQLEALTREANAQLAPILGTKGLEQYPRQAAGAWLRLIQPMRPPPRP